MSVFVAVCLATLLGLGAVVLWPPQDGRRGRPHSGDESGSAAMLPAAGRGDSAAAAPRIPGSAGRRRRLWPRSSDPLPGELGPTPTDIADALGLLAVALRSGCSPVAALEAVADELSAHRPSPSAADLRAVAAAHRWGLETRDCWAFASPGWGPAALAWQVALEAGAAPAALLERAGEDIRQAETTRVEAAVSRAGVLLVLPLGLAFLPAFVLTTVIPLVLTLSSGLL